MVFETYDIKSSLGKYVESIFYYKNYNPEHRLERVVPTGNIFVLFELDNIPRNTYDNNLNPNGTFLKVWISGMHQSYINISTANNSEMLAVQFKTLGASPFFKVPINELNNTVSPAEIYFGKTILKIREEVIAKEKVSDKFEIVERWLLGLLDEKRSAPQDIIEVLTNLQNQPFSKHNEVLQEYPKTQKHLIDQFKKHCGLTPKVLHRIFRFNKLLANINQRNEIIWTDTVYETGYADQSHFIKDFQSFCGFNPSKYIKNGYNDSLPNFFPLNKEG